MAPRCDGPKDLEMHCTDGFEKSLRPRRGLCAKNNPQGLLYTDFRFEFTSLPVCIKSEYYSDEPGPFAAQPPPHFCGAAILRRCPEGAQLSAPIASATQCLCQQNISLTKLLDPKTYVNKIGSVRKTLRGDCYKLLRNRMKTFGANRSDNICYEIV